MKLDFDIFRLAGAALDHASARQSVIAQNIANADTPGYRRKMTTFEQVVEAGRETGRIKMGSVKLDQSELERLYNPSHPLANEDGYLDGSNVSLVVEIADAREAQRSYEANLRMFDQARKMRPSLLELLRR